MNNTIGDMVAKLHPEFNTETIVSASNRIDEFLHDLSVRYAKAKEFIEDAHDGIFGVVLEYDNGDGTWDPCEMNDDAILYHAFEFKSYMDDEVYVGLYANWGGCWGDQTGDDWGFRLGVWKEQPTDQEEVIIGKTESRICHETYGDFPEGDASGDRYRMRKVPLGPFSDKAKKWMYDHIDMLKDVLESRCGEV